MRRPQYSGTEMPMATSFSPMCPCSHQACMAFRVQFVLLHHSCRPFESQPAGCHMQMSMTACARASVQRFSGPLLPRQNNCSEHLLRHDAHVAAHGEAAAARGAGALDGRHGHQGRAVEARQEHIRRDPEVAIPAQKVPSLMTQQLHHMPVDTLEQAEELI